MNESFNIFQDWAANRGNPKGRFILVTYRIAKLIRSSKVLVLLFFWYLMLYIFFVEWLFGVELTLGAQIGPGVQLWHGHSTVLNPKVRIGRDCIIRHNTTIGNKSSDFDASPTIGNNVNIGANVCIIGSISIGNNVSIGAGSVVVKDVPSNSVVVGNPARIVAVSE